MNMTGQPRVNRSYKDRLFRFIFNDKKELLALYNAINDTNYTDAEEITVNTLDNVIYMGMKNDISFLVSSVLNLYEHQSTWNPNMPYRNLIYTVDLLKGFVEQHHLDIYGSVPIKLPTPQAVVFFNGEKDVPEQSMIRLSDSFKIELDETYLEFKTLVLNINYGKNKQLMEKCKRLKDYAIFIDRVRDYAAKIDSLDKAIRRAMDECIEKEVLSDILRKHRGEVLDMILTEYDEQAHIANEKRWSFEEGLDKGIRIFIKISIKNNMTEKEILENLTVEYALESSKAKEYLETVKKQMRKENDKFK